MRKTLEERLQNVKKKQAQNKARYQSLQNRQNDLERKARTKRLIENGALAEQYLNCQRMESKAFEAVLKQLVAIEAVKKVISMKMEQEV